MYNDKVINMSPRLSVQAVIVLACILIVIPKCQCTVFSGGGICTDGNIGVSSNPFDVKSTISLDGQENILLYKYRFGCHRRLLRLFGRHCALSESIKKDIQRHIQWRGGSTAPITSSSSNKQRKNNDIDFYYELAKAIQIRLTDEGKETIPDLGIIVETFQSLASSQQAFKGLDGAAHEAYQRTIGGKKATTSNEMKKNKESDISSVLGRARRSIARIGAVSEGLFACELCDLIENPTSPFDDTYTSTDSNRDDGRELLNSVNGTLAGREVLYNGTNVVAIGNSGNGIFASVLVLFEPGYNRGSGVYHGTIEDFDEDPKTRSKKHRSNGRLLIIVSDNASHRLESTIHLLSETPQVVGLHSLQTKAGQDNSLVQAHLYRSANSVLRLIGPLLNQYQNSSTAIHIVGRSLGGGIASILGTIINGDVSTQNENNNKSEKTSNKVGQKKRGKTKQRKGDDGVNLELTNSTLPRGTVQGLGKGRVSVCTVGAPPCLSTNIPTDYMTSILFGDDIIVRSSHDSIDRLVKRTRRALKLSGSLFLIGKQINWMADAVSLATSNLQSHTLGTRSGSDIGSMRLSIPGRAYLIRPRRLGGSSSIHEVGTQSEGGREALRAAVLWQLNDIILSSSFWKHHQLESYIRGLDRVQLRSLDNSPEISDDDDSVFL